MRRVFVILVVAVAVVLTAGAAVLFLDEPQSPPELTSITRALDAVDFASLPEAQTFTARDGTALVFRAYAGQGAATAVLIHGGTLTSASMHAVAQALQARGTTVYSLGLRGHEGASRKGDVDYIGQLADDVADFIRLLPPRKAESGRRSWPAFGRWRFDFDRRRVGGGKEFDNFVLIAPDWAFNSTSRAPVSADLSTPPCPAY